MIYGNGLFPTQRIGRKSDGFSLLETTGYTKVVSPGCIALLPLGVLVIQNIAAAVRRSCQRHGFWEVALPLLQKYELWQESGRAEKYPGLLCETTVGDDKRYVINPTQEEAILDLFRSSAFLASDLPLRFFQIGERIRNEIRPAYGLIRSRCFTLADIYALALDEGQSEEEAQRIEMIMNDVLTWTKLPVRKGVHYPSMSGVSIYSYWTPSATKQCIVLVCRACGSSYRARDLLTSCPSCSATKFESVEAAEIGDVMRSGEALAGVMSARGINSKKPVHMAMAGIGLSRLLQLLAEYYRDDNGLAWPIRMAPFRFHIIAVPTRSSEARDLYTSLQSAGYDTLLDLRPHSFGRLLIDADLLGFPVRLVFGNKTASGNFEVKYRRTGETTTVSSNNLGNFLYQVDEVQRKEDST